MAHRDKAKVEAHIRTNPYAQTVLKAMEAGESDEKISKRLMDAKNRIMKYGQVNESKGTISSRFIPKEATQEDLTSLRQIEVATKLHSMRGHSEDWAYSQLSMAIDGNLPGGHPAQSKQLARLCDAAKKQDQKPKERVSISFKM